MFSRKAKAKFTKSHLRRGARAARGFTLIELVVALAVIAVLSVGIIPLVKISVKRQKERQLRAALTEMREAIKEFKRDTAGTDQYCATHQVPVNGAPTGNIPLDPRSHVMITDCTIFGVDNPDRYPPKLETLVEGVKVLPRVSQQPTGGLQGNATDINKLGANALTERKKIYLRAIPIDPMTGKADWDVRSCYDEPDKSSTGGENVFDVRSKSNDTALNGEKYSDW